MVSSARRAYSDATGWVRSARPADLDASGIARRAFGATVIAGLAVMILFAFASPSNFGAPGSATLRSGWPSFVLLGGLAACAALAFAGRDRLLSLTSRIKEPFVRPLAEEPGFEEAADALASCPAPFKLRFALAWVWAPAGFAVLGTTLAFSTAYFLVDSVLARGVVGWGQALYALASALLSERTFRIAVPRLVTWRLAASVHREVTTGYPA